MGDSLNRVTPGKQRSVAKFSEFNNTVAYRLTQPIVRILAKASIMPNTITWFGFLLSIGAAALIAMGYLFAAGFVVLVAGFFDVMDGALARHIGQITPFGAVLDSVLDRLSESALLIGILAYYIGGQSLVEILLVCAALIGSMLVSYVRARAEGMGLECRVGLLTRAGRVVVLVLGLLLSRIDNALVIALAIIAILSFITVGQRLFHVWKQTRN